MSAELLKLAHQLGVGEDAVAFLAGLPDEDLRALRRQIADALFEADRHHFTRMANLAKATPVPLAARISEVALPPLLSARTAEVFDPQRAAEMVNRMSPGYLADVAAAMDPARAPHVVAAMPPESVAQVGVELARRGEWVVTGAFVSFVSPSALAASVSALTGEQLLRVSFTLDDASRLAEISALLTDPQRDDLLASAPQQRLWRELDNLVQLLTDAALEPLRVRVPAAGTSLRAQLEAGPLGDTARERLLG